MTAALQNDTHGNSNTVEVNLLWVVAIEEIKRTFIVIKLLLHIPHDTDSAYCNGFICTY